MARLTFVPINQLTPNQKMTIKELQSECFSSVSREEVEQCFIAESFGLVFASENGAIVGQSELFMRNVLFGGREVILGGIGGVCVTASARNRGMATQIVRKCLGILTERRCDVACLNANVEDYPDGLYHRLGFRVMERKVSFEDVNGRMRYDSGEMFLPLCSNEIFKLIIKSDKTFHMGRGYW